MITAGCHVQIIRDPPPDNHGFLWACTGMTGRVEKIEGKFFFIKLDRGGAVIVMGQENLEIYQ